jgi:hypothetical protein
MPKIELEVGEAVVVTFKDTDGEITVAFTDRDVRACVGCREQVAARAVDLGGIIIHADMPDTAGRGDIIYHEPMGVDERFAKEAVVEHNRPVRSPDPCGHEDDGTDYG